MRAHFHTGSQQAAPVESKIFSQEFWAAVAGPEPPIVPSVGAEPPPSATSAVPNLTSPPTDNCPPWTTFPLGSSVHLLTLSTATLTTNEPAAEALLVKLTFSTLVNKVPPAL